MVDLKDGIMPFVVSCTQWSKFIIFPTFFTATPEKGVPDFQVRRVRGSVQLRQGLALGAGLQRQGGRKVLIQIYFSTNL